MASFHTKTFKKNDEYYTPPSAWINIKQYIPTDKIIWESFYCKHSPSAKTIHELGRKVICKDVDFFEHNYGDIIVSNPPFTKKKEVLTRLKELNKPFILIMPCSTITCQYFRRLFQDEKIQIIIPRKRIQFLKVVDGKVVKTSKCNFDCFYYFYKMNLPKDIIWLKDDIDMKKKNKKLKM